MKRRKILRCGLLLTLLGILPSTAIAENSLNFGDYVVHFNAFRSDSLTPEIAKAYQLTRRNNRMVVNITVLKRLADNKTQPVKAAVTGFASNLTGQVKNLEFREIFDGEAIYYLAQAQIANRETLKFDIKAVPENETISAKVKFKQQFFTD
ncbi:MAG: DUF4426 domain-containing protein [Gammaproteobacteria bacterium]|nr:DUF4426 domain-containing protein [Gammaproteobacteria bacterium]